MQAQPAGAQQPAIRFALPAGLTYTRTIIGRISVWPLQFGALHYAALRCTTLHYAALRFLQATSVQFELINVQMNSKSHQTKGAARDPFR